MWENWEKTRISDTEKIYSFLLDFVFEDLKVKIELTAMLIQDKEDPQKWKVLITAFHPSSGEYIDFEDSFQSFEEAEKSAWNQAQRSINIRKKRLS